MGSMKCSLGIDYGTNSVRALVVRCDNGEELGSGTVIIAVPEPETYFYAIALLASYAVFYFRHTKRDRLQGQPAA